MPRSKRNEVVAGLFVLLAIAAGLGVVLWLGLADVFKAGGQTAAFYSPLSEGGTGLQEGSDVRYGDSSIGKIVKLRTLPEQKRCLYLVRVDRSDLLVRADGSAAVVSPLIGSASLVVKDLGTSTQLADEAHPILVTGGLTKAMNDISAAVENVRKITENTARELDRSRPDSIVSQVGGVIQKLDKAAGEVVAIAANVRGQTEVQDANSIMAQLRLASGDVAATAGHLSRQTDSQQAGSLLATILRAAGDISAMAADARPKVERALAAVSEMAVNLEGYTKKDVSDILGKLRDLNNEVLKTARNFTELSETAKQMVTVNRDKIDELIDNLTLASADLKATAKEVRRNPWRLLCEPDKKTLETANLHDAARAFLLGAEELDAAIGKLKELSEAHPGGVAADDPKLQKVREHLKETFDKFSKAEQALWRELEKR